MIYYLFDKNYFNTYILPKRNVRNKERVTALRSPSQGKGTMENIRQKIRMGDIYRFTDSGKRIVVVTNENDEPYSSFVPVGAVRLTVRPLNNFFSLPVIMEDDSLQFAHANYSIQYDLDSLLRHATCVGSVGLSVVSMIRLCLCRRFIDDENYFRGILEEVRRYKQEILDLTGNKLIKVNPDAYEQKKGKNPEPVAKEASKASINSVDLHDGCQRLLDMKSVPLYMWSTPELVLLLDLVDHHGPTKVGRELKLKNPCQDMSWRKSKARLILKKRGVEPDKRHEVLKNRENDKKE